MEKLISLIISDVQKQLQQAPVLDDGIKEIVFGMKNGKSPGPNGYASEFFKDSWDVIGREMANAIRFFFEQSYMFYP